MIEFTVSGDPVAKGRPRFSTRGGFVRTHTPAKTREHEKAVRLCADQATDEPLQGPLRVEVWSFHPIPQSFTKARKQAAQDATLRPTTRPDVDNVLKLVCDALEGVAYENDSQVVEMEARKFYSSFPRTVVRIVKVA